MLYKLTDGKLAPVRWVVIGTVDNRRRLSNPTIDDCIEAGVDAYEYEATPAPNYDSETYQLSHEYEVRNGVITDAWMLDELPETEAENG